MQQLQSRLQTLTEAAQAALHAGWAIIPLHPETKEPFACHETATSRVWYNGVHSVTSASFGPPRKYLYLKTGKVLWTTAALASWEDGHACNPAIALELSDLTVIDIDKGIESEEELTQFLADLHIPITRCVRSGRTTSFAVHLYYKGAMRSSPQPLLIHWREKTVVLEVKSKDKYVCAEGSFHSSGQQYARLWDKPIEETPVARFTELITQYAPTKNIIISTFDGTPVTQEEFEEFLEKNGEGVLFKGFNQGKNAFEYIRENRCPWESAHTGPNGDDDFAIYIGKGGMAIHCVHESCKQLWTEATGWRSYRKWLATEKPKPDGTKGYGNVPMQTSGTVTVSGVPTKIKLSKGIRAFYGGAR